MNAKDVPVDASKPYAPAPPLDADRLRALVDQAVLTVLNRFNSEPDRCVDSAESGAVLWLDADEGVSLGEIRWGEGADRVSPYSDADRKAIIDEPRKFVGDYHTHTTVGILWTAHFPSAEDLQFESALCDYWHLERPVPGYENLKLAPQFQLVQSLWFGDVFVLERVPSRTTYESVDAQAADVGALMMQFRVLTAQYDDELGDYDTETSHDEFLRIAGRWIDDVNAILGKRCQVRIVPNVNFRDADPDESEGE
jgi:hypothetical protein